MIRINLLPYRAARSKENIRRQISVFLLSFILLLVVLIVYNGHLNGKKETLADNLESLKKKLPHMKKKLNRWRK
ncbi:MAG: hypothetical protein R2874_07060 [Desulfobacterales bacterium]